MSPREAPDELVLLDPADVLLDPNSFRLADDPLWHPVPDARIPEPSVQRATEHAVAADGGLALRDLKASLSAHGWIDVEPIRVRRLADGAWVIVDGNRRIVAWRATSPERRAGPEGRGQAEGSRPDRVLAQVLRDPDAEPQALALGLRQLRPALPWPELGAALWAERLNTRRAGAWPSGPRAGWAGPTHADLQALELLRRLRPSDLPEERADGLRLLAAALDVPGVADWLHAPGSDWDPGRIRRLVGWFLPPAPPADADGGPARGAPRPLRWSSAPRAVLRQLAPLLADEEVLRRLDAGEAPAELVAGDDRLDDEDRLLRQWVRSSHRRSRPTNPALAQRALALLREGLQGVGEEPVEPGTASPWPALHPAPRGAPLLRAVGLHRYRALQGLRLDGLRRINLLVGANNAGKTSVLEAVYLLTRLADPRGLLDTLRVRTRQDPERDPARLHAWIEHLHVHLDATDASGRALGLRADRLPLGPGADLAAQVPGLRLDATVDGDLHRTDTELFLRRPRRTRLRAGQRAWLAPAVLHSPYARTDGDLVLQAHARTLEAGGLAEIVSALQEAIDPELVDIRVADGQGRFIVQHAGRPPMDLTAYGEGLQRIFEIALLFAGHRGGVVLIDEVETAVHPHALPRFTRLLQELAIRLDVQVFLSTHSKEAVDAFLLDGDADGIALYLLKPGPGAGAGPTVHRYDGRQARRLVELGDADLRRL